MKKQQSKSALPVWLPEAVRQDPKKAGILGVLVLVLVIATVRWLLPGGGPAAAKAALTPPPTPATTVNAARGSRSTAAARTASGPTRTWLKTPLQDVSRNLFAIRHEYFPQAQRTSDSVANGPGAAGGPPTFWDSLQKSRDQAADQKRRREILVENLQREAAKLRLQSTVMGPEPQAIIGGSLVREGDSVAASDAASIQFRVLKIEARRVVIEREGIKLEVRMAQ